MYKQLWQYFSAVLLCRSPESASRRAADVTSWQGVFHRLQDLLQHAASVCYREGKINQVHEYKQNKYFQSGK